MFPALRKAWDLLDQYERKSVLALLGLMGIGMFLETLSIGMVIPAVSLLMRQNLVESYPALRPLVESLGNPDHQLLVVGGMLVLVVLYLIKAVFLAFLAWRQMRFGFNMQAKLSQRLFETYLLQPHTFHLQRNSAELIRNAITEVSVFTGSALIPGMLLMTEGLVLAGIASLMFVVEPVGALVVVLVLAAAVWVFHGATGARIARWGELRQYHEGLRMQHLQQGLGGAKDIKLLGREEDFLTQYSFHNTQSARMAQLQSTLQQFPRLWLELLGVTGLASLVVTMVIQGKEMSHVVSTLGLFAAAAFRLMPSMSRMLAATQSMRFGLPAVNTLYEELKLSKCGPGGAVIERGQVLQNEIRLANVCYTYPGCSTLVLENISLVIRGGESVGFVGLSGSGKSTLVDVILGLLAPSSGEVLADGKDIRHSLRSWQSQIGYVPQSIYLTDDTLRRNIAFGLSGQQIDDVAIKRAIDAAQLTEFVAGLPQGLETMVGERGVRLSGGQRQRIGIARALYHDPAILVLDEATSALDTETERGVMRAVSALQGHKTVLIVTHRMSTVEQCSRVYRLECGKLVSETQP